MNHSPGSTLNDGNSGYYASTNTTQPSSNIHIMTNDPVARAAVLQQQQQQQQISPTSTISMQTGQTRVINRGNNYLQIQPTTTAAAAATAIGTATNAMRSSPSGIAGSPPTTTNLVNNQMSSSMYQLDPKRARTLSTSLKSLLMPRSTSRQNAAAAAKRRDKSYDSPSFMMQSAGASSHHYPYDTQSGE